MRGTRRARLEQGFKINPVVGVEMAVRVRPGLQISKHRISIKIFSN